MRASPAVLNAVRRFVAWRESRKYEWRPAAVERALRFCNLLALPNGQPLELLPWQIFVIAGIFGFYDGDRRLTRRAFISVARKNGKSTMAAALGLKLLLADDERAAQVVCVARSRRQARIVFSEACGMVQADERLRRIVYPYRDELRVPAARGIMWAASADSANLFGYSLSGAIIDELHVHRDRTLWDACITSMAARQQPLLIAISTAGEDTSGLFNELRETAAQNNDDRFFAVDYFVTSDDWKDESRWREANPSLGATITLDALRDVYNASRSPAAEIAFRRYHLNQSVASHSAWIPIDIWRAAEVSALPNLDGRECVVGIDLASTTDLSAIVAVFPDDDGMAFVKYWAFCSQYAARSGKRSREYRKFIGNGELVATGEDVMDEAVIRRTLVDITRRYQVKAIYYDPAFAAGLLQRAVVDGLPESLLVEHPQYAKVFDAPLRETERRIYERKLLHERSELFDFCIANAVCESNSYGARRLSKKRSTGPIDLAVALVMAAGHAFDNASNQVSVAWL